METRRRTKAYLQDRKERYQDVGMIVIITSLLAFLFYRSVVALVLIVPVAYYYMRYVTRKRERRREKNIRLAFKDFMEILVTDLMAGYSLENAFIDGRRELENLHGATMPLVVELCQMEHRMQMNESFEQSFLQVAKKLKLQEIDDFSWMISFARRSGGNYVEMIQKAAKNLGEKITIDDEILTMVAQKRFEQKIMNVMPLFLLLYLNLVSAEYLTMLYTTIAGRMLMTICLGLYTAAFFWAERMMQIEV